MSLPGGRQGLVTGDTSGTDDTGDPFSDAEVLEEQPAGLMTVIEGTASEDERRARWNDEYGGTLEGQGTLTLWNPRHGRRLSRQRKFQRAGQPNSRASSTSDESRRSSQIDPHSRRNSSIPASFQRASYTGLHPFHGTDGFGDVSRLLSAQLDSRRGSQESSGSHRTSLEDRSSDIHISQRPQKPRREFPLSSPHSREGTFAKNAQEMSQVANNSLIFHSVANLATLSRPEYGQLNPTEGKHEVLYHKTQEGVMNPHCPTIFEQVSQNDSLQLDPFLTDDSGSSTNTSRKGSRHANPFESNSSDSSENSIERPERVHLHPDVFRTFNSGDIDINLGRQQRLLDYHRATGQNSRQHSAISDTDVPRPIVEPLNFSRPFPKAPRELEEARDSIAELPAIATTARHVRFDPKFAFSEDRRTSNSLAPEWQKKFALENEKLGVHPASGRRISTILVNRRVSKYTIAEEKEIRKIGKKRLRLTRNLFIIWFIITNGICISISWVYPKYWFIFVPVILLGNALNSLMVLNLLRWWIWGQIKGLTNKLRTNPPRPPATHIPTTIAMVLACYCESYEEILSTMESLNAQEKIDHHKKMFLIICDGQVKGKGAAKSTDRVLVEDILKPEKEEWFPIGYESWDGVVNGLFCSCGIWRGTPYVCLVKKRNLGKRDGLILVRTLLYKYSQRYEDPVSTMGDDFFRWFGEFSESCGIEKFEWLVGVDADTTFNTECIYEMHKECIKDDKLIGCSGLIQVGFRTGQWNLWNLYQNTEYIRAQLLRRMHQAHGTGKVSCLPGACQIIRVCEESCGDEILIDLFGDLPDPKANMIDQVRALAGEDRNYICLIFARYPKMQTTMALNAIAYTDPPNGLMVFLSQRKRWTLSTCANDILIITKNTMNWYERINSLADVITWGLPIFVAQTFILFIRACIFVTNPTFIVCFAIVTMIPLAYAISATFWGCKGVHLKLQYFLGLLMVVGISQFVTPTVIMYAIWHMDDFSWGKTREVEADGNPENKPAHSD